LQHMAARAASTCVWPRPAGNPRQSRYREIAEQDRSDWRFVILKAPHAATFDDPPALERVVD
jgi:hypothetical protein